MLQRKIFKYYFVLVMLLSTNLRAQNVHDDIMVSIRNSLRFNTVNMNVNGTSTAVPLDEIVAENLETIQDDGSWDDLDYINVSGSWGPSTHLTRMHQFATAYADTRSSYFDSDELYNTVANGLNYFYTLKPQHKNWWVNEIRVPRELGRILIVMRGGSTLLPEELENKILTRLDSIDPGPSYFTGANKIDFSLWFMYKGLLRDSEEEVTTAINHAYSTFEVTTKEGIQHDYSFFQHGPHFYPLAYGQVLLHTLNTIAEPVISTKYEFSRHPYFENYTKFLLGSYADVRRGEFVSFSAVGRQIVDLRRIKSGAGAYNAARIIDPANTNAYQDLIDRSTGVISPSTKVGPENNYYYRSLFTAHSRPEYKFTILANNVRTKKTEKGNGANIKGQFLSEGATNILVNGNEYDEIFPVWEWNKIPGTTTPEYPDSKLNPRQDWGISGTSNFAGGVSDGMYGLQVFDMNEYATKAKKAWFLFDDEIVCLGSDISSTAEEKITTTINQSLLDGEVIVSENGNAAPLTSQGVFSYENKIDWVLHDSIGYVLPNKGNIILSNSIQSGSRSQIKEGATTDVLTKEVFKFWFDHGLAPTDDSYAFIVLPGKTTTAEMQSYNQDNIKILENTTEIQAVKNEALDMIQIVFHSPKMYNTDGMTIGVDKACALILKNISTENVEVHLADPGENNKSIDVVFQSPSITPLRKITADLPTQDAYRGSTVIITFNSNTPEGYL